MTADPKDRVWEQVRRALGRLSGRVAVHSLSDAATSLTVRVRQPNVLEIVEAHSGTRQTECHPSAVIRELTQASAPAGGGGINLAGVATVIGADRALKTGDAPVSAVPFCLEGAAVHARLPVCDASNMPRIFNVPMRIEQAPVPESVDPIGPPPVRALPIVRAATPKRESKTVWRLAPARTQSGLAPMLRVPLVCRRLSAPSGVSAAEAFAPERRLLASAAGVTETDVALIGVFPHVPIGATHRLSLGPDGTTLQILIRPEAARSGARGAPVTVVLGRQRSTGKMLQAVRR